jgi:hypothetical protein
MFNETTYNINPFAGLGDAKADCLATVKGYPQSYVFKGARGTYSFSGRYGGLPFSQYFKNQVGEITNAVASRGYVGVSVVISDAVVGDGRGTVSFQIPIDQQSSTDVKNNVRSAIQGIGINISSDNISIANPSFDQICGAGGSGSPSTGTGSVASGPGGTIGSFFDNLASGIGISTPIAIAIAAGAALFILKR